MPTHAHSTRPIESLLVVRTPQDVEYLVKEIEVITGKSGRTFVVSGADRLHYRVHWRLQGQSQGVTIERLDATSRVVHSRHLLLWEFLEHSLMDALAVGQLFALPIQRHT